MAGGQFLTLLRASSRSSSVVKRGRPFLYNPIKNYRKENEGKHSRLMEERAPSTAEEFQRVAEEKAREAKDKTYDGAEEGDSKVESVNNSYKDHQPGADYRSRRGV